MAQHAKAGPCALCGKITILFWKDTELRASFGDCCFAAVLSADRVLARARFSRPEGLIR